MRPGGRTTRAISRSTAALTAAVVLGGCAEDRPEPPDASDRRPDRGVAPSLPSDPDASASDGTPGASPSGSATPSDGASSVPAEQPPRGLPRRVPAYGGVLADAWWVGDRERAARAGSPNAVEDLFDERRQADTEAEDVFRGEPSFERCGGDDDGVLVCSWTGANYRVEMEIDPGAVRAGRRGAVLEADVDDLDG